MAEHGAEGFWTQVGLAAGAVGAGVIAVWRAWVMRGESVRTPPCPPASGGETWEARGYARAMQDVVAREMAAEARGYARGKEERRAGEVEKAAAMEARFERIEENIKQLFERFEDLLQRLAFGEGVRAAHEREHRADPPWPPRKRGGEDREF